jgi:hypothetical protein
MNEPHQYKITTLRFANEGFCIAERFNYVSKKDAISHFLFTINSTNTKRGSICHFEITLKRDTICKFQFRINSSRDTICPFLLRIYFQITPWFQNSIPRDAF